MDGRLKELRGLKYIGGQIVQVGKASQEKDHGRPFWLCQTQPPHAQRFQPAEDRAEAIAWLRGECGAEEVLECVALPDAGEVVDL